MKHILAPILLLILLFPSLALGEEVTLDDLVETDGLFYKKSTDVPFTGKVTGQEQGTFKNGKKEGPWVEYWDNGRLQSRIFYKNGEKKGPSVFYFDDGQLWGKGDFKNGEMEGPWVEYNDNGQLLYEGNYKNGKREGPWVVYQSDGTVWEEYTGTYKNDVKVD